MYRNHTHLPSSLESTNLSRQEGADDSCHRCGGSLLASKPRPSPSEIIVTLFITSAFVSCATRQRIRFKEHHSFYVQHSQPLILILHSRLLMTRDYGLRMNPESFVILYSRSLLAGKRRIWSDTRELFLSQALARAEILDPRSSASA